MPHQVSLTINGEPYTLLVEPYGSLLDMLRDQLQLTGTKKGCGRAIRSTPYRPPLCNMAGSSAVSVRPG